MSDWHGTAWLTDGRRAITIDYIAGKIQVEADILDRPEPATITRIAFGGDARVTHHANVDAAQDALDGAALRRLREAVREQDVSLTITFLPTGRVGVQVTVAGAHLVVEYGDTPAEAADKCRERLEGKG